MSWFYEALQRAERTAPRSGKGNGEGPATSNGGSFLAEIEMLSSLSVKIPTENAEAETHAAVAIEELAQNAEVPAVAPPEVTRFRIASRHVTLPPRKNSRLIFHTDPHGMAAEQFRLLRRKLTQEFSDGGVLMVTSPTVGDGKTLTSINLCSCLAELHEPTLLIEADLRRPTVGEVLSCPPEPPGMEAVLSGEAQPAEAIHLVEHLGFHAAMVARLSRDPSQLINGGGFRRLLGWARQHFRWIVLDASPVLPAADVADLLPQADCVLLIIRADSTPRELSKRTFEILGKHLRGVIFNGASIHSNPYYRYLGGYYQPPPAKNS